VAILITSIGSGPWPTKGKGDHRQKNSLQNKSAMDRNHIIAKNDPQAQEFQPNTAQVMANLS